MIVKTEGYTREQVGKVVQLRADVEGLKLSPAVLARLATEGEKSSLRFFSMFAINVSHELIFYLQIRPSATRTGIDPSQAGG